MSFQLPRLPWPGRAFALLLSAWLAVPVAAHAALPVGSAAPDVQLDAALDGKPFRFRLAEALRQGPVVLYFYPKAFTAGCTVEAHLFAEATPQFRAQGATVVGVSSDDLDTLRRFSTEHCRSQFAVAADPRAEVIRRYDAGFTLVPSVADRISYVISPQGKVLKVHAGMDPEGHVRETLKAVGAWRAAQPPSGPAAGLSRP